MYVNVQVHLHRIDPMTEQEVLDRMTRCVDREFRPGFPAELEVTLMAATGMVALFTARRQ